MKHTVAIPGQKWISDFNIQGYPNYNFFQTYFKCKLNDSRDQHPVIMLSMITIDNNSWLDGLLRELKKANQNTAHLKCSPSLQAASLFLLARLREDWVEEKSSIRDPILSACSNPDMNECACSQAINVFPGRLPFEPKKQIFQSQNQIVQFISLTNYLKRWKTSDVFSLFPFQPKCPKKRFIIFVWKQNGVVR